MKVWIVNPYGTVPGEGWRDYRSYMLAKALSARGHDALWFMSDFVHRSKTYRQPSTQAQAPAPGIRIKTLHASPYGRNISFGRIAYERSFGESFAREAAQLSRPDAIVLADPSLFYAAPVVRYAKAQGCKLILDVIDLWPELFGVVLPGALKPFQRQIFSLLYRRRDRLAAACDGVAAVTGDYLEAVCPAGRFPGKPRQVAYWGVDLKDYRSHSTREGAIDHVGGFRGDARLVVAYAGTLGDAYDMNILEQAIARCAAQSLPVRFVVAGDGPKKDRYTELGRQWPQTLKFLGPIDARDLALVYAACDVGLMSYVQGSTVSMPIKFYDYLAGGLAIVNSLGREAGQFVTGSRIGLNYQAENLDSLMGCIGSLAADATLLATCKANSLRLADDFDSARQHDLFAEFIEQIVDVPGPGPKRQEQPP